jgi:uncharacterized protein (DUF924 family)
MQTSSWRDVYDFWFPSELKQGSLEFHKRMGGWWMQGGATPELSPFAPVIALARSGALDHWAATEAGRLSLIIVLDQFPRGLFAGNWKAYASDRHALRLCEEGLENGHYDALRYPWERFFFTLPMLHTEGSGHLDRIRRLLERAEDEVPIAIRAFPELKPIFEFSISQLRANHAVIAQYDRFPHRNDMLCRPSTPDEVAYIEKGDFVHLRKPPEA